MKADEMWTAVVESDQAYDGVFFYGVKTTKIYCRPSCKSKLPKQENVVFFGSSQEAQAAEFCPCKRCRSDLLDYQPMLEAAAEIRRLIDNTWNEPQSIAKKLQGTGISKHRMSEIFKEIYGETISGYIAGLRLDATQKLLSDRDMEIIEIAHAVGFDSLSAFYRFFKKETGQSPAAYRKAIRVNEIPRHSTFSIR